MTKIAPNLYLAIVVEIIEGGKELYEKKQVLSVLHSHMKARRVDSFHKQLNEFCIEIYTSLQQTPYMTIKDAIKILKYTTNKDIISATIVAAINIRHLLKNNYFSIRCCKLWQIFTSTRVPTSLCGICPKTASRLFR